MMMLPLPLPLLVAVAVAVVVDDAAAADDDDVVHHAGRFTLKDPKFQCFGPNLLELDRAETNLHRFDHSATVGTVLSPDPVQFHCARCATNSTSARPADRHANSRNLRWHHVDWETLGHLQTFS